MEGRNNVLEGAAELGGLGNVGVDFVVVEKTEECQEIGAEIVARGFFRMDAKNSADGSFFVGSSE